jgi:predicted RNA binding protein YcfA (HicA-like mRNA interferase family)
MAQADKTIEKIKAKPTSSNIKWDELVVALKHLGYKEITNSGSRRKFFNVEMNNLISLHRPHPGNEVKPCYIKDVRETLEEIGLIEARK